MFGIAIFKDEDLSSVMSVFETGDETRILRSHGYGSRQKGVVKFNLMLSAREAWIVHAVTGAWLYKHFGEDGPEDFLTDEELEKINRISLTEQQLKETSNDEKSKT